jgi:GT2 family glycosyltransferase
MKDITIIIVNYNTSNLLHECLIRVEESTIAQRIQSVVVDNGSSDDSVEMCKMKHPTARLISFKENIGFGRGNNIILHTLDTPFALLINTDTFLDKSTAEELLDYMSKNEGVGIAGPKVFNADGSIQLSCRKFPSMISAIYHAFLGKISSNNRKTREYLMADFDHSEERDVDWLSGCCMMMRKEALRDVGGGFDEQYFMYFEDVDICRTMHNMGWRVCYFPKAECHHIKGSSGGYQSPFHIRVFHQSMWKYFKKFHPRGLVVAVYPLVFVGIKLRQSILLMSNMLKKSNRSCRFMRWTYNTGEYHG